MKFCTKCGSQMTDEMEFCSKCGAKCAESDSSYEECADDFFKKGPASVNEKPADVPGNVAPKLRTSMKVWMIICFVFAGVFAAGSFSDSSMLAGVCLFGILGVMFLVLARTPIGDLRLFASENSKGISKGAFVCICVFISLFLFFGIINLSSQSVNTSSKNAAVKTVEDGGQSETTEQEEVKNEPEIPAEFAGECPVSVSASMYDNIINFPEISCNIRNNTDKEIAAVQLYFLPKDVYGEEVDGIFAQNRLECDTLIAAGSSYTGAWQLIDQDVKSGDLYVYSVYFSDGTEWGDRNASLSKIKEYGLKLQVSY